MSIFSQWLKKPLGSKKNVFRQIAPYVGATAVTAFALSKLAPKQAGVTSSSYKGLPDYAQIAPAKASFIDNVWGGTKVAASAVNTGLDWGVTAVKDTANFTAKMATKVIPSFLGLTSQQPNTATVPEAGVTDQYIYNPWAENVPASQFSSNPDLVAAAAEGGGGADSGGQGSPEPITAGGGWIMGLLVAGVVISMLLHKKGGGAPGIP